MFTRFLLQRMVLAVVVGLFGFSIGCSKEQATKTLDQAETSAEEVAETIVEDAEEVVEEGKQMAVELGEKAAGYLTPMKEKLGNLESLKKSPEELKKAVTDLIASIEGKAEGLKLPEAVSETLATLKEKLVSLQTYLEGEVDEAKIGERVDDIITSVKSGLGM